MVIIIIFSFITSYYFISYYLVKLKSQKISNKKALILKSFSHFKFINRYILDVNEKLSNLNFPYGLSLKSYLIIKYVLSVSIFFIAFLQNVNLLKSIILFLIIFYLPNILIYIFKKREKQKVINDISNIVQNLILSLACKTSLYNSLILSSNSITYDRLKYEINEFINSYRLYNFNVKKASYNLTKKMDIVELKLFINIIEEVQQKGNDEKILIGFLDYLDEFKIKNSSLKVSSNTFLIIFITFLLIINSFLIVIYPISIQIINNLNNILN